MGRGLTRCDMHKEAGEGRDERGEMGKDDEDM